MDPLVKKALGLGAGLIALYLIVEYSNGFSNDVKGASTGGVNVIQAFQGR